MENKKLIFVLFAVFFLIFSGKCGQSLGAEPVLEYNNLSGYVIMPNSASFNANNLTILAWVKPNSFNSAGAIVSKAVNGPPWVAPYVSFLLRINNASSIETSLLGQLKGFNVPALPINSWAHIAMVYDGNYVKVYENGVLQGSVFGRVGLVYNSTQPIIIGADYSASPVGDVFNGSIKNVAVYDNALSESEIMEMYTNSNGSNLINQTNVTAMCTDFGFQSGIVGVCCDTNCTRRDLSQCYNQIYSCIDYDSNLDFLSIFSNVSAGLTTYFGASCAGAGYGGGGSGVRSDFCVNGTVLSEAECGVGNVSVYRNYSCLNGCSNGACVNGINPQVNSCSNGCISEGRYLPYGIRYIGKYCDIDGTFKIQKSQTGAFCENNYECRSNSCANGACAEVSGGFQRFVANLLCTIAHPMDSGARADCVAGIFG